jgi:hypothetical protein
VGASGGEDHERIGADNIRPDRWQRPHPSLSGLSEEDSVLAPSVGEADHLVFVAVQWMERVRYTESLRIAATAGS